MRVLELVGATPESPKDFDVDVDKYDGGLWDRRRSGRERIHRVLFTESLDSDSEDKFHKKRNNTGGERNKKVIKVPPAPIFKKKTKKKNENEAVGKKKTSNGYDRSSSRAAVTPIFSGKGKCCHKGITNT